MKNQRIAFIGGGNMASSLIGGLISDGCDASQFSVSDPDNARLGALGEHFGVHITPLNTDAAADADVVILAIKPQAIKSVALELASVVQARQPLVISIAAGVRTDDLATWLGGRQVALVRAMPNTPALVRSGATALYATNTVSDSGRELAESILRAVGLTLWVDDEALMDAVTALSGSGPAYFFLVMEALEAAGQQLGLSRETARLLTLQTAFGAAKMALESTDDLATLRQHVTSPGGTTEQAINTLEAGHIRTLFAQALAAAHRRSQELAQLFGGL